ncbi:hypothetical protein GCM10025857_24180 [Alicyclobacillus contaminans]|uniref:hypothetical protein n=1 Tax=Alicyclobacillus contaminans TaxID=392016 RepID=UPI000403A8F6|nr:hypothetical protein [Alicyclobacillus contaminans]GMA51061.1 hypothetical protein GCM10025857_24180 [Alicyclobacillus contaminans]
MTDESTQRGDATFDHRYADLFSLSESGQIRITANHRPAVEAVYLENWPGLLDYVYTYTEEWMIRDDVADKLYPALRNTFHPEQKVDVLVSSLELWGLQVCADVTAALCLLEADAAVYGNSAFILQKIRKHARSYSTYIARRERELILRPALENSLLQPGDGFYLAAPLLSSEMEFFRWNMRWMSEALLRRRPAMEEAFMRAEEPDVRWDVGPVVLDILYNMAVIAGFVAHRQDFKRYYQSLESAR